MQEVTNLHSWLGRRQSKGDWAEQLYPLIIFPLWTNVTEENLWLWQLETIGMSKGECASPSIMETCSLKSIAGS